MTKRYTAT